MAATHAFTLKSITLVESVGMSSAPKFYVMSHRSAPRMLAALAGLVHHSQRTHGDEHKRAQDNDQGAFHSDLAPRLSLAEFSWFRNEPGMNVLPLRRSKLIASRFGQ